MKLKEEIKELKKFFKKHRPDKNKIKLGDGKLSWKIRHKKAEFKFNKKLDSEVELIVKVKVTGELYKFRKPSGLNAKFEFVKKF